MSGLSHRRLLLFTKPARPGRVKTRLIGDLTAVQAADLHAAFLGDVLERLQGGEFELTVAWALEPGEAVPEGVVRGVRQEGAGLGERLYGALSGAAREVGAEGVVMALGSDHPTVPLELVEEAFGRVEAGAEVVLGPAEDGGYYLIALAGSAVVSRIFEEISWSTGSVLAETLERCREVGVRVELLPVGSDVDTPEDLVRLAGRLAGAEGAGMGCPRTRELLAAWGMLQGGAVGADPFPGEEEGRGLAGAGGVGR